MLTTLHILTLFVTYLHEFGHALAALFTGGNVASLAVNTDGSGVTVTSGGIRWVIEIGGYIGSVLFGNLLFRVGLCHKSLSKWSLFALGLGMVLVSVVWFSTWTSLAILMGMGIVYMLVSRTRFSGVMLACIGLYTALYAIYDYNVGPTSDLKAFSGVLPATVWMYVWLGLALLITGYNFYKTSRRLIYKKK